MDWVRCDWRLSGVAILVLLASVAKADDGIGGLNPYATPNPYAAQPGAYGPSSGGSFSPGAPPGETPLYPSTGFPAPAPGGSVQSACAALPRDTLYVRVDYFNWRESMFSERILEETGPLVNLGFLRYDDLGRFRTEIFGGRMNYDGGTMDGIPLESKTDYFGFRIQYDLLYPLGPAARTNFLLGLGTRFWNRDLRDSTTPDGEPVMGYNEVWWTVYPLLGLETRRPLGLHAEWFASACMGWTGFTYERVKLFDAGLHPKMGPLAQGEIGIQGQRLSVSVFAEWMQWYTSGFSGDPEVFQPDSRMFLLGLSGGYRF